MNNIEKIEVNTHYVWVDVDAEICNVKGKEDWNYCPNSNQIFKGWDKDSDDLYMMGKNLKPNKIIAASPELNLEGIPSYFEYSVKKAAIDVLEENPLVLKNHKHEIMLGVIKGYQIAEKELPNWEDVRKAIELGGMTFTDKDYSYQLSTEEIIEQLKKFKK